MKPAGLLFALVSLAKFDEIPAVETEADRLACNDLSPSPVYLADSFYHKLLAVMDFIFHVDLSTAYVVLRRDFVTSQDSHGTLSSPVGAGFYCTPPRNASHRHIPGSVLRPVPRDMPLTNHICGQTRPRLPTRRRGHTAPEKPPKAGAS